jgi:hypothetical protein
MTNWLDMPDAPRSGEALFGGGSQLGNGGSKDVSRVHSRREVADRKLSETAAIAGMSVNEYQRRFDQSERERQAEEVQRDLARMKIEIDQVNEKAAFEQMKADSAKIFNKD